MRQHVMRRHAMRQRVIRLHAMRLHAMRRHSSELIFYRRGEISRDLPSVFDLMTHGNIRRRSSVR
jgi:hypothetical protein